VEEGKLALKDPVATYWPEFRVNGKTDITVRALLTHYSGLRPDLNLHPAWRGYETALKLMVAEKPRFPPDTRFLYSDINFAILGELVQRISGLPFDGYCARHIFTPLGVHFYTYITTMAYAMEAAAKKGIAFYVLDRPNPLSGAVVQGPILDADLRSFTGYFPLPVRHGMTVGELAHMFNAENHIGAKLHVITMRGYRRTDWYDETGLRWVAPSPNLRTLTEATLYPGVAMVEGANVSVGRGTETPFELLGAPWMNGEKLAAYLNQRQIHGVRFVARDFTPTGNRYAHRLCHGVQIVLADRQALDVAALGVEIASALYRLSPRDFHLEKTLGLIGARWVIRAIKNGRDPRAIVQDWHATLGTFHSRRAKYLLYSVAVALTARPPRRRTTSGDTSSRSAPAAQPAPLRPVVAAFPASWPLPVPASCCCESSPRSAAKPLSAYRHGTQPRRI
jgi:hypothetical protein